LPQVTTLNKVGQNAEEKRDWTTAADAFACALIIDPRNVFAMIHRANARMSLEVLSLYGRAVAWSRLGETEKADADRQVAV
jgi:hypothetical protein